jgi:hypothetical protein
MSREQYLDAQVGNNHAFASFDGKMGSFVYGADKTAMPAGEYLARIDELQVGFRKFNGPGELPDVVSVRFYGADPLPTRPSEETVEGLDGGEQFVWQHFNALPLEHVESGETFLFSTVSKTGRKAVANLCQAYDRKKKVALPVVRLEVSSFKHKDPRVGKVKVPVFAVMSWQADEAPRAGARPDFDDDIPFAPEWR